MSRLRKAFALAALPVTLLMAGCEKNVNNVTITSVSASKEASRYASLNEQGTEFKKHECRYTTVIYDGGTNALDGHIQGAVTVITKGSGSEEMDQKGHKMIKDLMTAKSKGLSVTLTFDGNAIKGPKEPKHVELDCGARVPNPLSDVKFIVG